MSDIEWGNPEATFTTSVLGYQVFVEDIGSGLVTWHVGSLFKTHSAKGYSDSIEEAKRMAVIVAEAMPEGKS